MPSRARSYVPASWALSRVAPGTNKLPLLLSLCCCLSYKCACTGSMGVLPVGALPRGARHRWYFVCKRFVLCSSCCCHVWPSVCQEHGRAPEGTCGAWQNLHRRQSRLPLLDTPEACLTVSHWLNKMWTVNSDGVMMGLLHCRRADVGRQGDARPDPGVAQPARRAVRAAGRGQRHRRRRQRHSSGTGCVTIALRSSTAAWSHATAWTSCSRPFSKTDGCTRCSVLGRACPSCCLPADAVSKQIFSDRPP